EVTLQFKNDSYVLIVRDYGRGISTENQARVFEPFFTTGRISGGTGLGLSIVHNIVVNILKGKIGLNSSEKGTEFIVTFPREIL
ncbi:MAG: HAMP domain-containing sensor histidine kinase, partial [Anaerolineales bacterium]|nr:HAMP domain-containing sensor histidine kinase [Anaerolineales bacterium]